MHPLICLNTGPILGLKNKITSQSSELVLPFYTIKNKIRKYSNDQLK